MIVQSVLTAILFLVAVAVIIVGVFITDYLAVVATVVAIGLVAALFVCIAGWVCWTISGLIIDCIKRRFPK